MDFKPRIFQKDVQIRFSDIDRYQHVNTCIYPDYVFTSRFEFMRDTFGFEPDHFEKRALGFYTVRFESNFRKSIPASKTHVSVRSFVAKADKAKLTVSFTIHESGNPELVYCEGGFDFFVMDLKVMKPLKELGPELTHIFMED
jgi:acyl-CoA thioesterase FadM